MAFSTRMILAGMGLVLLVVGIAAWLTYLERIDGSALTFLFGLVVGYVLTFIGGAITPRGRG